MGSYVMHLCVSDAIKKKLKLSNKFIYGSLLPDVIKSITGDREHTHYIVKRVINGEQRELPDIKKAINDITLKDKEIEMGYIAHLVEDYIWFNEYIPTYAKVLDEQNVIYLKDKTVHSKEDFSREMYSDYYNINKYIIQKYNIDVEEVKSFLKYVLNNESYNIVKKNMEYRNIEDISNNVFLTKESIDSYIEKATYEVEKVIKKLGE